jgi:signal transduction histidine kinase
MSALRPLATAIALVVIAAVLFGWTVREARRQRSALEDALTREASLLANSLGPGLVAASNASRELEELVFWKLLDNARLIAALKAGSPATAADLEGLLEANGLDSIVIVDSSGKITRVGETFDEELLADLAPLLAGEADDVVLGSTMQHAVRHLAAAARVAGGGAVLVRVEWLTAQTFARRIGVENLLLDLLGTGAVLYLSYTEEPGSMTIEGAWNGGPVPAPSQGGGLRTVYGLPIFEVDLPLEAPAGSTASLRIGLDGSTLTAVARQSMLRNLVIGLVLAAFATAGTGFAFVSHLRSREREEAAKRISAAETARRRSERLAAAGALTAGLAHEVRSPMNAIGLAAQRLERKLPENDERRTVANRIGKEVRRLDEVLRGFLELASPVSNQRQTVELGDLVCEVVELLETEAEAEDVELVRPTGVGRALVDAEAMRRALINLLRNAIQASPPGGRVEIVVDDGEEAIIRIKDQGPGIDPALAGQVFDPFVTGRPSGTGLGLALVRRVIEEHEGTVSLESLPYGGAEALIRLPRSGGNPE